MKYLIVSDWILLNFTPHKIDLYDAEPYSISGKKDTIVLDSIFSIRSEVEKEKEEDGGLYFIRKSYDTTDEEIDRVLYTAVDIATRENFRKVLIIVSLTTLIGMEKDTYYINGIKIRFSSIVPANNDASSDNNIIACIKYFRRL